MVIRKIPGKNQWRLYSIKTGRNLGTYNTKEGAVKRERQIAYFKFRSGWGAKK